MNRSMAAKHAKAKKAALKESLWFAHGETMEDYKAGRWTPPVDARSLTTRYIQVMNQRNGIKPVVHNWLLNPV